MKQLINLIKSNLDKPRSISVDNEISTIWIYDTIGADMFGGVDAQEVARQIASMTGETITLRINSPGGDVFAGRAIAAALKASKAKVVAYVDGLAASAATTILMAADEIVMAEGSFLMVHNSMTFTYGNKEEFLEIAGLLEQIDEAIAADYIQRTGKDKDKVKKWMDDETWFSAADAVEQGFADSIADTNGTKNAAAWNLSAYNNAPKIELDNDEEDAEALIERLKARLSLLEKCPA